MRKGKRSVLGLVMALVMVLASVPIPELKVQAAEEYGVWVGDQQFTSEKLTINGSVKGQAIYDKDAQRLTFNDFEGVEGEHEVGSGEYALVYTTKNLEIGGTAVLEATGENHNGIRAGDVNLVFLAESDITVTTGSYSVYSTHNKPVDIYGKLHAKTTGNLRGAIQAYELNIHEGAEVTAEAEDQYTSGLYAQLLSISGGTVDAVTGGPNGKAIFAGTAALISGGTITASATGSDGIGISTFAISISDGDITASGTAKAVEVDATSGSISVDPSMYFVDPVGGKVSTDGKKILKADDSEAKSLHLVKPENYGLWVGNTQVNNLNKDAIPGIVGGGSASYDPENKVLSFNGTVTGIENEYDDGTTKALIYATDDLCIRGTAAFEKNGVNAGIYMDATGKELRIEGDVSLKSDGATLVENSNGTVVVAGTLKLESTAESAGLAVIAKKLVQESGSFEVHSKSAHENALYVADALNVYSGTFSVVRDPEEASADASAITTLGDVLISGGSFSVDNGEVDGHAVNVGGSFRVLGGNVEIKNKSASNVALLVSGVAELSGGKVKVTAAGLSSAFFANDDVTIDNAEVELTGGYYGVQTLKKLEILSGVLKAKGGYYAIDTTDGLVYDEAKVSLTKPTDGIKGATTITESDGITKALEVWLEGGAILYPVWVGSTQVSSTNKTDIPGVSGGSASYDPDTNTLSFTGEVTGVEGTSTVDGFTAKIFSTGALTIKGNVQLNNMDIHTGIGAKGKLVLDGNFYVSAKNFAVMTNGVEYAPLVINGKLEASSREASAVSTVSGDITVAGEGLFATTGSDYSPAVDAGKKLILNSGVLDAQGDVYSVEAKAGIRIPAGYVVTIPGDGKLSSDKKTVVEGDGMTEARHARIEKATLYDLWVGKVRVNSNNAKDIPSVTGGKASYDPESRTLTFTGDACELSGLNEHDAYGAQIYAGDELTIEGKVKLDNETALYGIYTKGKLTIAGIVEAAGKSHGVLAENSALLVTGTLKAGSEDKRGIEAADILVQGGSVTAKGWTTAVVAADITVRDGELTAQGENAAVEAKSLKLDGGSVNAHCSGDAAQTDTVKLTETLTILNGDAVFTGNTTTKNNVLTANGGIVVNGGSLTVKGEATGGHTTLHGIQDSALTVSGGTVSIEMKGAFGTMAIDNDGKDVTVSGGSLTIQANSPARTVSCENILVTGGSLSIQSDSTNYPVYCGNFTVTGGTVDVLSENGTTAIVAAAFHMEGGKLTADSSAGEGHVAIQTNSGMFTLGGEVSIVEPAGGRISDDASRIADAEGNEATKVVLGAPEAPAPAEDLWNLFESDARSFEIAALSSGTEVSNMNAKSLKFYDATLNGKTISVKLKSGVNRKQAAKPANTLLQFDLGAAGVVEYVIPVQYVKPAFKLSTKSAVIRDGAETTVKTQVLVKTEYGVYEPCDLSGMTIKYGSIDATGDADGYVSFKTSSAGKGAKLILDKPGVWESSIALKFNVKASSKDVLSVDTDGRKVVLLNKKVSGQYFEFPVSLNGAPVTAETAEISKGSEVAELTADGNLKIAVKADTGAGNYTVTVSQLGGKAKVNIKVKVSDKDPGQAVVLKVRSKYDVVTGQKMLVEPQFKEAEVKILSVTSETDKYTAELDAAGNILIDYSGERDVKKLNLADITLKLQFEGVTDPVSFTLSKVKAKKTNPKLRSAAVTLNKEATGEVKASVNVVCTYKDGCGRFHTIVPTELNLEVKKTEAVKNAEDICEIDILSLAAKSGSVKLKLKFAGGAEKKVSIKVKKAK
ncbi:MAG: carbohydrate-binding domain-containing protein [Lachnospiraceae bacterium]|nr:carbohydrate-binding domain-containing protein [Lachnospiraceae bacterium]